MFVKLHVDQKIQNVLFWLEGFFSLKTYKNQLQSFGVQIQFHIFRMVKRSESITITLNFNDSEANEHKICTSDIWFTLISVFWKCTISGM